MKKLIHLFSILALVALLLVGQAGAQSVNDLVGVGMPSEQANLLGKNREIKLGDGTVSAPSCSFSNDTDTGLYRIGANRIGVVTGGAVIMDITTTAVTSQQVGAVELGTSTYPWESVVANDILSESTTDIGWTIQSAANQACNTTCTKGCVFGWDTSGTQADIVNCAGATADECLCAGAS